MLTWSSLRLIRSNYLRTCTCHDIGPNVRFIFSTTGTWKKTYNRNIRQEIESHWKPIVRSLDKKNEFSWEKFDKSKEKYYVLSMFPYPSGKLHMGHVRVYTISDVIARFRRLQGKQVFHPMGWDAFGLPAENAAMERGVQACDWTESNIAVMKDQLKDMLFSFDWNTELKTCDPSYYKWTQHIFLQMFHDGLAYQREGEVNWDPVDQTVLAKEQIVDGKSWRSGALVEKKYLKQWYLRTTALSKSLVDGLNEIDTSLWKDTAKLQRFWLGKPTGCHFSFQVKQNDDLLSDPLMVYTRHPEFIFGASHIAVAPSHRFNKEEFHATSQMAEEKDKDICLNLKAVHPFTGQELPVILSSTTKYDDVNNVHIGIPFEFEEDKIIAEKFGLHFEVPCVNEKLINSEQFTGLSTAEGKEKITEYARSYGFGGYMCSHRITDWLISRQRYWGTPIPIIHCPSCQAVPVPESDLPVILPKMTHNVEKGVPVLQAVEDWLHVKCPKCGGDATRDTDTMDTFVDSTWYFMRYLDSNNSFELFSKERAQQLLPVDLYIGGKEHALMHLYFARFISHYLYEKGLVPQKEPFVNLLTQGMVMGKTYKSSYSGKYLQMEEVDFTGPEPVEESTGANVIVEWDKMSKSKKNGVDPQAVLDENGVDLTRLCIVYNVAPYTDRKWSGDDFKGVFTWQNVLWRTVSGFINYKSNVDVPIELTDLKKMESDFYLHRNKCIEIVLHEIEMNYMLNNALTTMHGFTNQLKKIPPSHFAKSAQLEGYLCDMIIMMSPFVPMYACELWAGMKSVASGKTDHDWEKSVLEQKYPQLDGDYPVKVYFKVRGKFKGKFKIEIPHRDLYTLNKDNVLEQLQQNKNLIKLSALGKVEVEDFNCLHGLNAQVMLRLADR